MPRAVGLADELLDGWAPVIERLDLVPSDQGRFEVTLDDELIYSKAELGRHAEDGEVAGLVRDRLGPEVRDE
ncbi:MAG: Rdx family protein [Nitriliruptorales bacterium]|nr:Rdx family protein [Nitriliruptorales bacterium]